MASRKTKYRLAMTGAAKLISKRESAVSHDEVRQRAERITDQDERGRKDPADQDRKALEADSDRSALRDAGLEEKLVSQVIAATAASSST